MALNRLQLLLACSGLYLVFVSGAPCFAQNLEMPKPERAAKYLVTTADLEKIKNELLSNPALSGSQDYMYDPSEEIGYCFGRAFYAQLRLLSLGQDPAAIKKVVVKGQLWNEGQFWEYHMITAAYVAGSWWAIDIPPWGKGVEPLNEWVLKQKKFDRGGDFAVDVREHSYFSPGLDRMSREEIRNPAYSGYFQKIVEDFKLRYRTAKKLKCDALFAGVDS